MKISRAGKADFKEWFAMAKKLWPGHTAQELTDAFNDILRSPRQIALMCRNDKGEPIGFADLSIRVDYVEGSRSSPVGYLEGIFVEKPYRNRGVAKLLARKGEEWAAKRGCKEMGSDAEARNKQSHAFHKAIGFKEAERIVAFIKAI